MFDEVMVAVTAGELSPIPSGIIYCAVIGNCHLALDLERALEWTAALDRWCSERPDMVTFSGQCQSHRAELFMLHGPGPRRWRRPRLPRDFPSGVIPRRFTAAITSRAKWSG